MKHVFALRGKSKTGKSQTIRTVVEMLTEKHPDATVEHNHTTKVDVRIVLTINGLKVGIESQGKLVEESLDLFVKIGCDVIVCATRTSGATVKAVNALQGFDVHWLEQQPKSQPHEQVLRSLIMAREISANVQALIASAEPVKALSRSANA